jgi:hypothetical protein
MSVTNGAVCGFVGLPVGHPRDDFGPFVPHPALPVWAKFQRFGAAPFGVQSANRRLCKAGEAGECRQRQILGIEGGCGFFSLSQSGLPFGLPSKCDFAGDFTSTNPERHSSVLL